MERLTANQYVTEVNLARTPTDSPTAGHAEPQLVVEPSNDTDLGGDDDSEWVKPKASSVIQNTTLSQSPILADGLAAWAAGVRAGSDSHGITFDRNFREYYHYFRHRHFQIHRSLSNERV